MPVHFDNFGIPLREDEMGAQSRKIAGLPERSPIEQPRELTPAEAAAALAKLNADSFKRAQASGRSDKIFEIVFLAVAFLLIAASMHFSDLGVLVAFLIVCGISPLALLQSKNK